jgi:hypothetical protein
VWGPRHHPVQRTYVLRIRAYLERKGSNLKPPLRHVSENESKGGNKNENRRKRMRGTE